MHRIAGLDPASNNHSNEPEMLFIGAILRKAVSDARMERASDTTLAQQRRAQDFLRDQAAIDWWAELVGADGDVLGDALRLAAGVEDDE